MNYVTRNFYKLKVFTKVADDDIIVPTLFGGECEDIYDSIPEFCGHNLSDDSFVYPSSMR